MSYQQQQQQQQRACRHLVIERITNSIPRNLWLPVAVTVREHRTISLEVDVLAKAYMR